MDRSERLNQELIFLSYKNEFHVNDLMAAFDISKRTALRDIQSLEQLGLTFYVEPGRYGGYKLTKRQLWVPVLLNIQEINALFFAIKALSLLSATPFEKSYTTIYQKLMATLPLAEQQKVTRLQEVVNYYTIPNLDGPKLLRPLLSAILNETVVTLQLKASKMPQRFQLFDLLFRNGVWFVSGVNLTTQNWEIIRCDTVTALTETDQPAQLSYEALKQRQTTYDQQHHDIAYRCKLTPHGREIVQRNHYANMQLESIDGQDYLYGGYNQDEYDYMIQYLLALGTNVQILAPEALQTGYLAAIDRIRDMYR
ncbi:WYL domain-containing protein [Lactiplantibacillus sp. WILCCON 0030]|uniref:WYL domain-containing protein n=1 Tax=Lactiplantibacillus brownii TaxID=3069269 RepID=A0ABU1ABP1_9LACO|nr:WYL domain-containing protein [Lactiplantibacillus brownii]MDQ7938387.1 WYL domain-containing protein [Lactiplantibacillus brownii]